MVYPIGYISCGVFIAKVTPTLRVRSKVWLLEAQDPKSRLTFLYLRLDPKVTPIAIFILTPKYDLAPQRNYSNILLYGH